MRKKTASAAIGRLGATAALVATTVALTGASPGHAPVDPSLAVHERRYILENVRPDGTSLFVDLRGDARFRIAWRIEFPDAASLDVRADGTVVARSAAATIAVLPSGEVVAAEAAFRSPAFRAPLPVGTTIAVDGVTGIGETGNRWGFRPSASGILPDTVRADALGRLYFHDRAGRWYALDRDGRLRYRLAAAGDDAAGNAAAPSFACEVTPGGDAVCRLRSGLFAVREEEPAGAPKLVVDGREQFWPYPVRLIDGATYAPARALADALGLEIRWDDAGFAELTAADGKTLQLSPGSAEAALDGRRVRIEPPAALLDGKLHVPLRAVAESFGARVVWEPSTKTVHIARSGRR